VETGENNFLKVVGKKPLWESSFQKIPKNFNEDIALQCLLIFQVDDNSISFALVNKNKAEHIGLGQFCFDLSKKSEENINQFFLENNWLSFQFSNVILIERNRVHTLIPEVFYEESIHTEYLKNISFLPEKGKNHKYLLKSEQAANLSILNERNYDLFKSKFGELVLLHHHDVLLEMTSALNRLSGNDEIILNLNINFFDLVINQDKKLKFCNSFYFEEPEDILYYTLLVLENHDLDPSKTSIKIMGSMAGNNNYLDLLKLYIPLAAPYIELKFIESNSDLKSIPPFLFATLQNGFLCV